MDAPGDEIVRIGITKNGGHPSSINMDLYLAEALSKKVGGEKASWLMTKPFIIAGIRVFSEKINYAVSRKLAY